MIAPHDLDLLSAYLDGDLDAGAERDLEGRLKTEPELARELVRLSRQESILREWAGAMLLANPEPQSTPDPTRPLGGGIRAWIPWLATLAVAVLIALAVGTGTRPGLEPAVSGTAILAQLHQVVGQVKVVYPSGESRTPTGVHNLFGSATVQIGGEGSRARIEYADGSRLDLTSGTTVRLEPDGGHGSHVGKQVILMEGLVVANVQAQPEDRPMLMTTAHALLKVPGSRFSSSTQSEATRVELDEGRLQVVRTSDGKSIDVTEGLFAIIQKDEPALMSEPLPPRVRDHRDLITHGGGPILSLAFSPNGYLLAIGGWDGSLLLWDANKRQPWRTWKAHPAKVKDVAWMPDGKMLLTVGQDKQVKLWDAFTGEVKQPLIKLRKEAEAMALSADAKTLAVALVMGRGGPGNEQIRLFDLTTGQEIGKLTGHNSAVSSLVFLPNGQTLATAGRDGLVKVWSVETQTELATLRGHLGQLNTVAADPDGRTLASGGRDGVIKLWDTTTFSEIRTLPGHPREVRCLGFSPDGRVLASCGTDGAARLWDMHSGQELMHLTGMAFAAPALTFSRDGRYLGVSSWDPQVKVWELPLSLRPHRMGL